MKRLRRWLANAMRKFISHQLHALADWLGTAQERVSDLAWRMTPRTPRPEDPNSPLMNSAQLLRTHSDALKDFYKEHGAELFNGRGRFAATVDDMDSLFVIKRIGQYLCANGSQTFISMDLDKAIKFSSYDAARSHAHDSSEVLTLKQARDSRRAPPDIHTKENP